MTAIDIASPHSSVYTNNHFQAANHPQHTATVQAWLSTHSSDHYTPFLSAQESGYFSFWLSICKIFDSIIFKENVTIVFSPILPPSFLCERKLPSELQTDSLF